ncbi:hypothetical protein [Flavisphingomonas formosensis]|uniref:hypothetical protein n=1 Tax=Flavisphingomonas formosensis TaxID=861534 RepID=UPI0018DFC2C6|nr:hypothetical protein [Sphingomonas formosensis]
MSDSRPPRASGAFIALSVLAGAVIGTKVGQPTIGIFCGTAVGVAIALLLWLMDRSQGR